MPLPADTRLTILMLPDVGRRTKFTCKTQRHAALQPFLATMLTFRASDSITSYYLLTPWSRVLLEKLTGSAASQEIPRIYGTRTFFTVPTSARHPTLSRANSIQSPRTPPTSWRSILILSSHLRLGLPNWSLSLRLPHQQPVHPSILPHTRHMSCPSHSSRFYHPHNIGWVQIIQLMYVVMTYISRLDYV